MIQCPNCKAEIQIRVVSAETTKALPKPLKDMDSVGALLHGIDMDSLNDYEREFIENTRDRYEKWGDKITLSDKQMNVLRKIAGKSF